MQMSELLERLERARSSRRTSFQYAIGLQLMVTWGVKNIFDRYAEQQRVFSHIIGLRERYFSLTAAAMAARARTPAVAAAAPTHQDSVGSYYVDDNTSDDETSALESSDVPQEADTDTHEASTADADNALDGGDHDQDDHDNDGNNDDDGIVFLNDLVPGSWASFQVTSSIKVTSSAGSPYSVRVALCVSFNAILTSSGFSRFN